MELTNLNEMQKEAVLYNSGPLFLTKNVEKKYNYYIIKGSIEFYLEGLYESKIISFNC